MTSILYQDKLMRALAGMLAGRRLPHALLLEGIAGSGKMTIARYLAAGLVCQQKHPPCGSCEACSAVMRDIHPDVQVIAPQKSTIGIEAVRAMRADSHIKPNQAPCKVYIIRQADTMTIPAQNALLKTLEEPADGVVFILTATSRLGLSATIRSRVTTFALATLSEQECRDALTRLLPGRTALEYEQAAAACGGSIGVGLQLLQEQKLQQLHSQAQTLLQAAERGDGYTLMQQLRTFQKDREGLIQQLQMLYQLAYRQGLQQACQHRGARRLPAVRIAQLTDIARKKAQENANLTLLAAWLSWQLSAAGKSGPCQ